MSLDNYGIQMILVFLIYTVLFIYFFSVSMYYFIIKNVT